MRGEPQVTYRMAENLTGDQIAEAQESLMELARILGRAITRTCHEHGLEFDMDDPQVTREVMMAALEALVLSKPAKRRSKKGDKS
jgi:hypothetical protein